MKTIIKVLFASLFLLVVGMDNADAQRRRSHAPHARVQIHAPVVQATVCGDYPIRVRRSYRPYYQIPRRYARYQRYGYGTNYNWNYRRSCGRW